MLHFNCNEDYILEDDFVRLSPLKVEHVDALLDIAGEEDIWKYSFVKGDGPEQLRAYINATLNNRNAGKDYPFVVFDKIQNQYAGSTRYYEIIPALNNLRIGYTWYGSSFRGTGLNKHCKYLLFDFAFRKMGVERIGLGAYIENERSIRAMESVGCQKEGILRGFLPAVEGEGRTDAIMLSILKTDWETGLKTQLENKLRSEQASFK